MRVERAADGMAERERAAVDRVVVTVARDVLDARGEREQRRVAREVRGRAARGSREV